MKLWYWFVWGQNGNETGATSDGKCPSVATPTPETASWNSSSR